MSDKPAALRAALRCDFASFIPFAFNILNPGQTLDVEWHHLAMAHVLECCLRGERKRQTFTLPPRSLKSTIVSVAWAAWLLGLNPTEKIICVSYAEELAKRHAMDTRRLMASAAYRSLFPRTVLNKSTELTLETDQGGFRYSTTIGGTVTGLGANWIIIDDPSKAEEALSSTLIEKATTFYNSTLSSRLNDPVNGRIIVTMQRLHQADLVGHCLERGGWHHLMLPAIAEEDEEIPIGPGLMHLRRKGDLLSPKRMPQSELDEKRRGMGSIAFQAQYQQMPIPPDGNIIKREWLATYSDLPDRSQGRIIQSLDTAQKTNPANDYSVLTTWLKVAERHYLIDVFRERCDFPTLRSRVIAQHDLHRPERLLIEDAGSGTSLVQDLKAQRSDIRTIPIKAKEPKDVRIGAVSAFFESRQVLFPKDAHWLDGCIVEVLGYPSTKYDDIIDSIAQYLNWVRNDITGFSYDMGEPDAADEQAPDPEFVRAMGLVFRRPGW